MGGILFKGAHCFSTPCARKKAARTRHAFSPSPPAYPHTDQAKIRRNFQKSSLLLNLGQDPKKTQARTFNCFVKTVVK
jgi:hypothetical protein